MSLESGARLGPYEIVSRLGAGGMGEVFRARDTRLDRTVAVKTLPAQLSKDAQLRLRFQREAKAISALSHPNICALYDVGDHDGVDYLVMEYLEGETLADRIARGPLPLREALRVGIELAAALERAHREGVIHRDLKPGNVMLTRNGAKLLDFGLAKSASSAPRVSPEAPTMQHAGAPLTAEGTIVGTFQYMAPEQIEGADVDARTDIFSFGALLYETITGTRAFGGKTKTSLIASIVGGTPRPMSELVPLTPPALEHVVQRCLEKEPDARWQSAHDLRLELEWIARQLDVPAPNERRRVAILPWAIAALATAIAIGAIVFSTRRQSNGKPRAVMANLLAPAGKDFTASIDCLSVSPDGRFVTTKLRGDQALWVRTIASGEMRRLEGTENGNLPFWSPDSREIAFFADDKLKKVALSGAPPVTLCDAPEGRDGGWNADGVILFAPSVRSGLSRISAAGGSITPVTKLAKDETTHRWVRFLPDGKHFLYFAGSHDQGPVKGMHAVYVSSLDAPAERKLLLRARSNTVYSAGHLLWASANVLLAQKFDADKLELQGEPFRVADSLDYSDGYFRGAFDASRDGMLVYQRGMAGTDVQLFWQDAGGARTDLLRTKVELRSLSLSRDGRRVVGVAADPVSRFNDVWMADLDRKVVTRLTSTPENGEFSPQWTPDGTRVVFLRTRAFSTTASIVMIAADGSREEEIVSGTEIGEPAAISPDGSTLLYELRDDVTNQELINVWAVPLVAGAKPRRLLNGPHAEAAPRFSPDGRWLLWVSTETGRDEVFAARFPDLSGKPQISVDGAGFGQWIAPGTIMLFTDNAEYDVPVQVEGGALRVGTPVKRPKLPEYGVIGGDTRDGKRFIVAQQERTAHTDSLTLTTNWFAE
ncbi:MAG TPA: protein kinase, partial [Thermoanaerobaculia bacterium]|nr:protein kinase [Thermoanaerobaculia bacterium]